MRPSSVLRKIPVALLLLVCNMTAFSSNNKKEEPTWADLPDFTATENRGNMSWKIYHSGSKLRVDASSTAAAVYLPDQDKVYHLLVLPGRTTCVEMKTEQSTMMPSALQLIYQSKVEKKDIGKEVLDGHPSTIQEGTTTGPMGETAHFKLWTADDLKGVPLKSEIRTDRGTMYASYRDIKLGSPDPALFNSPVKCIPPDKTYQVAPQGSPLPTKRSGTDKKAPTQPPQ